MSFDIDVVTFKEDLELLAKRVSDIRPLLGDIIDERQKIAGKEFRQAAFFAPSGGKRKWRGLATSTLERSGPREASTPLRRSGHLRLSWEGKTRDSIREIKRLAATFGVRVPYAPFHITGTSTIPARPHGQDNPEAQKSDQKLLEKHLLNGIEFEN